MLCRSGVLGTCKVESGVRETKAAAMAGGKTTAGSEAWKTATGETHLWLLVLFAIADLEAFQPLGVVHVSAAITIDDVEETGDLFLGQGVVQNQIDSLHSVLELIQVDGTIPVLIHQVEGLLQTVSIGQEHSSELLDGTVLPFQLIHTELMFLERECLRELFVGYGAILVRVQVRGNGSSLLFGILFAADHLSQSFAELIVGERTISSGIERLECLFHGHMFLLKHFANEDEGLLQPLLFFLLNTGVDGGEMGLPLFPGKRAVAVRIQSLEEENGLWFIHVHLATSQ
mmetsp:Transcript_39561/g.99731  ORF Transcript_39561/g.99731 Transcript_39561/m.99731 type:complete len:287 (-) Transcript_39561:244-1104(-)